ncbi:MAG: RDD family protein [Flavobacteriales bacterium]|nr:RDD family protein [Flavobacteriales bacterium]
MINNNPIKAPKLWKRFLAFSIDVLIVYLIGMFIGELYDVQLIRLGSASVIIGYMIAASYFTLLNSRILNGQTVGKHIFKIKVQSNDGNCLSVQKSFLRFNLYAIPFFAQDLLVDFISPISILYMLFGNVFTIFVGANLYFSIFNGKFKQTIPDIICNTVVHNISDSEVELNAPKSLDYYVVAAFSVIVITGSLFAHSKLEPQLKTYDALQVVSKTNSIVVNDQTTTFNTGSDTKIIRSYYIRILNAKTNLSEPDFAKFVAQTAYNSNEIIRHADGVRISIGEGLNIGIYSRWASNTYDFNPKDFN